MPDYPAEIDTDGHSRQATGQAGAASLGERIRALRKSAGLTLEDLSDASGVSRAAVSKIERGEMSPTYESLLKLARGLGIELATLVSGRGPTGGGHDVTRAGRGVEYRDDRYAHRLLAPDLADRSFHAFVTEVRATRLEQYDAWDRHDSEDFLYVLDGTVAVHLADRKKVVLKPGDSMQMDGRIPHALIALSTAGGEPGALPVARLLWISVPGA